MEEKKNVNFIIEETDISEPELYSVSEFAKQIGVHPQTVRRWDKTNKLCPKLRTKGGQRKYTSEQIEEYLNGQQDTKHQS